MIERAIETNCRCAGTGMVTLHHKKAKASIGAVVCTCAAGRAIPVRSETFFEVRPKNVANTATFSGVSR